MLVYARILAVRNQLRVIREESSESLYEDALFQKQAMENGPCVPCIEVGIGKGIGIRSFGGIRRVNGCLHCSTARARWTPRTPRS